MGALKDRYEYIIVGSGAGGGTLVHELARRGKTDVLLIELGEVEKKIGDFFDARRFFDWKELPVPDFMPKAMQKMPLYAPRSKEGILLWRAIMAGGTTVISCGNGARSMEKELESLGIDLKDEYEETEQEMGLAPTAERLLSSGSRAIRKASDELGYKMQPMPKYVDPKKCVKCSKCIYGCSYGAKWTTLELLQEAQSKGVDVLYNTRVINVTRSNGKVTGVRAKGPGGVKEIEGKHVILAAGALATPVILQKSGIEAGDDLFLDLMWNTYGFTDGSYNQDKEPVMAIVDLEFHSNGGFLLSPFMNHKRLARFPELKVTELGPSSKNLIGIMTKITDDANGKVFPDGSFSKPITERDWERLNKGASIAQEIITKTGAKPGKFIQSKVQGAHPGGTAAIGTVVDTDLQTKLDNLFVCDASVFPAAQFNDSYRLPPIVSIVALAKRLGKALA